MIIPSPKEKEKKTVQDNDRGHEMLLTIGRTLKKALPIAEAVAVAAFATVITPKCTTRFDEVEYDINTEEAGNDTAWEADEITDELNENEIDILELSDPSLDVAMDDMEGESTCRVYTETQNGITMHLGTPVTVGNASIVYAEEVSAAMDRFEVSYCDGTVVDNNFRVGESSGTNRDYPAYTFRISIRNIGSSGGAVTADISVTEY